METTKSQLRQKLFNYGIFFVNGLNPAEHQKFVSCDCPGEGRSEKNCCSTTWAKVSSETSGQCLSVDCVIYNNMQL